MFPVTIDKNCYYIDEKLLSYEDELLFFTCRDLSGQLYLAQYTDDNIVIMVKTSVSTIANLKNQDLSLYDAFSIETEAIYIEFDGSKYSSYKKEMNIVSRDDLPLPGYNLFYEYNAEETAVQNSLSSAVKDAQDIFKLRLVGPNDEKIVGITLFSKILGELKFISDSLLEICGRRFLKQDYDKQHREICLIPVTEGSFEINLISPTQPNLINETGFTDFFDMLTDLLDCRDQSLYVYSKFSFDILESLRSILYSLKKDKYSFDVSYVDHRAKTIFFTCTNKMIEEKYTALRRKSEIIESFEEKIGFFYGINMKRKRFYFVDRESGDEITGAIKCDSNFISVSALNHDDKQLYQTLLKKVEKHYESGEVITDYFLDSVNLIG